MATLTAGYLFSRAAAIRQWATRYRYDHLSELVGTTGAGQQTASYTYDQAGNRTNYAAGTSATAYTYDTAGRLTAVGPYTATSDADGNLTGLSGAGVTQTFAYDQANRLTGITTNGATTTDTYNGDGLRVSQTSGGTTTTYLWDVNASLPQVLSDGSRTYVYGLGLAYSVDASNNVQVYHTDGLGSVRALTEGGGSVIQTYRTDAFGNPVSLPGSQGTASQPFGFAGQQRDQTGLVYLRARYYAPALGRFMSRDPLVGSPGLPLSLNRYTYGLNDPMARDDPGGFSTSRALKAPNCLVQNDPSTGLCAGHQPVCVATCVLGSGFPIETPKEGGTPPGEDTDGQGQKEFGALTGWTPPTRLARVVPAQFAQSAQLGAPTASAVFVADAADIAGITDSQALAERLTHVDSSGKLLSGPFAVIEFDAPPGLASPVFRTNPGFVPGGRTAGGAREYVLPNYQISSLTNVTVRIVP